ncbi:MAG: nickel pincer cofactor biosynthesis protein LarC [Planctomycetota bacterium]|nr:nickel pincer cofactor biosynthesis protein LarC [Planctomycetota bacterium]
MNVAYFDCFSGASGDMIIGALLDAGAKIDALRKALAPLRLKGVEIAAHATRRCGLRGTKFDVIERGRAAQVAASKGAGDSGGHHARLEPLFGGNPRKMISLVKRSRLHPEVKNASLAVIERLVAAEAKVHGCRPEDVHLHELACADTIVDVVGAVSALRALGVERVFVSALPVCSGVVKCAHGLLPVPPPATLELMKGLPVVHSDAGRELVTPTGAAILGTIGDGFGTCPEMTITRIGYGAGAVDPPGRPNMLRVIIGEPVSAGETDTVLVFETNVDNMTGEEIGFAMERFFAAGALDAYAVPLVMKKSRPGTMIGVIAPIAARAAIEDVFLRDTGTMGVRWRAVNRTKLRRESARAETVFGAIRVKRGTLGGKTVQTTAEYDDCRRTAIEQDVPLRAVRRAALRAGFELAGRKKGGRTS